MKTLKRLVLVSGGVLLLAAMGGCASMKPYPNTLPKNLEVSTFGAPGGSRSVSMRLYEIKPGCKRVFLGTVRLYGGEASVGVPVGRVLEVELDLHTSEQGKSTEQEFSLDFVAKRRDHYRLRGDFMGLSHDMSLHEFAPGYRMGRNVKSLHPHGCFL